VADKLFSSLRAPDLAEAENASGGKIFKAGLLFGSSTGSSKAIDAPLTLWTIPELASVRVYNTSWPQAFIGNSHALLGGQDD